MEQQGESLMGTFKAANHVARLRAAAVKIAKDHGVNLIDREVTEEVQAHWFKVQADEAHAVSEQYAKERRSMVWRAVGSVIPDRYRGINTLDAISDESKRAKMVDILSERVKDVDAYDQTIAAAKEIAEGRAQTILFGGVTGAGKSTLAALLLRSIAYEWHKNWREGVTGPRSTVLDGDPTFARLLCANRRDQSFTGCIVWTTSREIVAAQKKSPDGARKFIDAAILVIDDIGGEPTQTNIGGVDEVLWARHDAGRSKVTILTTGFCDPKSEKMDLYLRPLASRYSVAFTRRVSEPGSAIVIKCNVEEVS